MDELISLFAFLITAALFTRLVGFPLIERRSDLETLTRLSKLKEDK